MKRLAIAMLLVCAITVMAQQQRAPQTDWEYKFIYECSEGKANTLGREGWELAGIQSTGPGIGNNVPTYVFKRLK